MEVRATVSVNPGVSPIHRAILVDHYNLYNRTPVNKEAVYPRFYLVGRIMRMVVGDKWCDSSIYESKFVHVRVIGEYENFLVVDVLGQYETDNPAGKKFTTTINKHDIYRGIVDLMD